MLRRRDESAGEPAPRVMRRGSAWFVTLTLLLLARGPASAQAIGQGVELERAGQFEQAASIYFSTLRAEPTNFSALLGLERVLPPLNRLVELVPVAQRALGASPTNAALRAVLLRTYVALNEPDSARALALRWAAAAPRDEAPYREWAMALGAARQQAAAREVLLAGRRALGRADAFGIELAELSQLAGDWEGAAREWSAVLTGMPVQLAAARSVLERVAGDTTAPPDAQALAQRAVVEALIEAGQLDDAAQQLATNRRLAADDRAALRLRLASACIVRGELDRAEATLAGDSTVDALALQGWIALYRGPLREAQDPFRSAGPFAGDREDATERTAMLALLQQVPLESFPELGGALLLLAQGDSTRAVPALRLAAERAGGAGRPAILLLAGRVAARTGGTEQQEEVALGLFAEVVRTAGQSAAAPAAELEWARLLARRLQTADAIQHLEHLILTYPRSAVVPAARRELERARGAIPKS